VVGFPRGDVVVVPFPFSDLKLAQDTHNAHRDKKGFWKEGDAIKMKCKLLVKFTPESSLGR
jgi:hypothetical protein